MPEGSTGEMHYHDEEREHPETSVRILKAMPEASVTLTLQERCTPERCAGVRTVFTHDFFQPKK